MGSEPALLEFCTNTHTTRTEFDYNIWAHLKMKLQSCGNCIDLSFPYISRCLKKPLTGICSYVMSLQLVTFSLEVNINSTLSTPDVYLN